MNMVELNITHEFLAGLGTSVDDADWNNNHNISGGGTLKVPQLIEEKVLPAGTTSATFSNLNGDVDEEYLLEFELYFPDPTDRIISLKPNGLDTNLKSGRFGNWSGSVAQNNYAYWWLTGSGWSKAGYSNGFCRIKAKTGKLRAYMGTDLWSASDLSSWVIQQVGGWWSDTATNLTSLVVVIGAGSFSGTLRLYKMVNLVLD